LLGALGNRVVMNTRPAAPVPTPQRPRPRSRSAIGVADDELIRARIDQQQASAVQTQELQLQAMPTITFGV